MHTDTRHQVIERDGKPQYVIVPYEDYLALTAQQDDGGVYLPDEVVRLNTIKGKSLTRSWREFLGLTQKDVARRMGISPTTYAKLERSGAVLEPVDVSRIASALSVRIEQLRD